MSLFTKAQSLWESPSSAGRTEESLSLKLLEVASPSKQDWSMETNYWRYNNLSYVKQGYSFKLNKNKTTHYQIALCRDARAV